MKILPTCRKLAVTFLRGSSLAPKVLRQPDACVPRIAVNLLPAAGVCQRNHGPGICSLTEPFLSLFAFQTTDPRPSRWTHACWRTLKYIFEAYLACRCFLHGPHREWTNLVARCQVKLNRAGANAGIKFRLNGKIPSMRLTGAIL